MFFILGPCFLFCLNLFPCLTGTTGVLLTTMSSNQSSLPQPPNKSVVLDTTSLPDSTTSSVWDRISNWVSENKALVYTIAGVAVVVTSAGVVYYLSDSSSPAAKASISATEKKKAKNQKRKEKKRAEEAKAKGSGQDGMSFHGWIVSNTPTYTPIPTTVSLPPLRLREKKKKKKKTELTCSFTDKTKKAEEPAEEIPEVDETTVGQLSDEVRAKMLCVGDHSFVG